MPAHFTAVVRPCATCGKPVRFYPSRLKDGARFCSHRCYGISIRRPFGPSFWAKVEKTPGCWIWNGPLGDKGHGSARGPDGKKTTAHRVAWIVVNGPISADVFVLHNCPGGDNPRCVRPDHLFLGDHKANMADMSAKGRSTLGTKNSQAKLTEAKVTEMRRLYREAGWSRRRVAEHFGISFSHCYAVLRGTSWPHV